MKRKYQSEIHSYLAFTFMVVVLVDMCIMPLVMAWLGREWHCNTMAGSGAFYIAFGAILGVGAWSHREPLEPPHLPEN